MPRRILDVQQGSPEWFAARSGCVTSSKMSDVMAKVKSGEAAGRRNYRAQLVAERLTGQPTEGGYCSAEMQRGTEMEPFARAAYEMKTSAFVDQVGFVLHGSLEHCGASPDGLVGTDGLVELKCPNTATHIGYILAGTVPADYQLQMLWQMECAERLWCDFVSFDPRLPEHLQLFVRRMERDEERLACIRSEVQKFLAEVDDVIARLPLAAAGDDLTELLEKSVAQVHHKNGDPLDNSITNLAVVKVAVKA